MESRRCGTKPTGHVPRVGQQSPSVSDVTGEDRRPRSVACAVAAIVLVVVLVASRARLVAVFGGSWTDEDQALLWFAARELGALRIHEPYFFGQPYGSWLEALLAAPLAALGLPYRLALPIAGSVYGTVPWLVFAAVAWWRRHSPAAACGILAAAAVMSVEGSIVTTMPRGLSPGIVLGCLGAGVVLAWPTSRAAGFAFGTLLVVAASLNVGSALVTAPVAAWFLVSVLASAFASAARSGSGPASGPGPGPAGVWRAPAAQLAPLGAGLVLGALAHVVAQRFYVARPAALIHHAPAIGFRFDGLTQNAGELARYVTAYAPEAWRAWWLVVAAVVGVGVWMTVTSRSLAVAAAASTAVVLALAILGTAKSNDGTASIFFPFSRLYLGLPWMVCALAVLPGRAGDEGASARSGRRGGVVAACTALALAGLIGAGVREVRIRSRADAQVAVADRQPPVAPSRSVDVEHRCELRRAAAERFDVEVVLDRYDRAATYGCAALLPARVTTLFPEYDRRSWVQRRLDSRTADRVLVSGLDGCPPPPMACAPVDEGDRLYFVSGAARPATTWAADLGFPVRPLP